MRLPKQKSEMGESANLCPFQKTPMEKKEAGCVFQHRNQKWTNLLIFVLFKKHLRKKGSRVRIPTPKSGMGESANLRPFQKTPAEKKEAGCAFQNKNQKWTNLLIFVLFKKHLRKKRKPDAPSKTEIRNGRIC